MWLINPRSRSVRDAQEAMTGMSDMSDLEVTVQQEIDAPSLAAPHFALRISFARRTSRFSSSLIRSPSTVVNG